MSLQLKNSVSPDCPLQRFSSNIYTTSVKHNSIA